MTDDEWYEPHWPYSAYSDPAEYIESASSYFESEFDIILIPGPELTWSPSSDLTTEELLDLLYEVGGSELDLDDEWKTRGTTHGENHGFDIIAGFTGYRSDHCGRAGAIGSNNLVVTGGNPTIRVNYFEMENLFQHELSHCYTAEDRGGFQTVMGIPIGFLSENDWGSTDTNLINSKRGYFDGA